MPLFFFFSLCDVRAEVCPRAQWKAYAFSEGLSEVLSVQK